MLKSPIIKRIYRFLYKHINKIPRLLLFIVPIVYFISFILLRNKIGFGWDSPSNLYKGEQLFWFLKTLDKKFLIDGYLVSSYKFPPATEYNSHPPAYSLFVFIIGNAFSGIFKFKYWFFNLPNVLLFTFFLHYFGFTVLKVIKSLMWSVFAQILLISIPLVYIHSIVNLKDMPVAVFSYISVFILIFANKGNFKKIYFLSLFLICLAMLTKLTAIVILPFWFILGFKKIYDLKIKFSLIYIFGSLFLIFGTSVVLWPNIFFNHTYELARLKFLYTEVPVLKTSESFVLHFIYTLPVHYLILFVASVLVLLKNYKDSIRVTLLTWIIFPLTLFFLISTFYDGLRHFLFALFPLTLFIVVQIFELTRKESYAFKFLLFSLTTLFFVLQIVFISPFQISYVNSLTPMSFYKSDYWAVSYPIGIDYIKQNYPNQKIHFLPGQGMFRYYDLENELAEQNLDSADVILATVNSYWYFLNYGLLAQKFNKDVKFEGRGVIEVWLKK